MTKLKSGLKNITFSSDDVLIEAARSKAREEKRSLNDVFRDWLRSYVGSQTKGSDYLDLMKRLKHVRPGRRFTRDEMNER